MMAGGKQPEGWCGLNCSPFPYSTVFIFMYNLRTRLRKLFIMQNIAGEISCNLKFSIVLYQRTFESFKYTTRPSKQF